MASRVLLALGVILGLSACGLGGPRLDPLTEQDLAAFSGANCRAVRDGAVVYATGGEAGLVRYNGRAVGLVRFRRNLPFDPADTDSLMMTSSDDGLELSFRGVVQPPGEGGWSGGTYRRQVMLTVEDRSFGSRRINMGADWVCQGFAPRPEEQMIDMNEILGNAM